MSIPLSRAEAPVVLESFAFPFCPFRPRAAMTPPVGAFLNSFRRPNLLF